MGEYERGKQSVDGLAGDLLKARPEEIRAITKGKADRITSEQAHKIAREVAEKQEKGSRK